MGNFFARMFVPKLEMEVIDAYFRRLPNRIQVSWKRDDGFILGEIFLKGDTEPIYTQARTPKEFVRMVNDAVYIALDFKSEYIDFFHAQKNDAYAPNVKEWQALNDGKVTEGAFGSVSRLSEQPASVPAAV